MTTIRDHGVPRSRLPTLTSLRFFAAGLVVLVHLQAIWPVSALARGQLGVSFFYLLSGFILAWAPSTTDNRARFYRRRFARIYPTHVLTWLIALVIVGPLTGVWSTPLGSVLSLPLVQAWVPKSSIAFAANGVTWSLSVEVLFYVTFPFLLVHMKRLAPRSLWILIAIMLMLMVAACAIAPKAIVAYVFPPARLPEFVIGIALALLVQSGWRPPITFLPAAVLTIVAIAIAFMPVVSDRYSFSVVTVIPFALLIAAASFSDMNKTSRLAGRGWVRLGEWSFALFMTHQLIVNMFVELVPDQTVQRWLAGPLLMVCVAIAAAVFRYVEQPMERLLRGAQQPD
ncbi:acyltransferase family protein [Geodermatophilus sp. SYSU D00867]